MKPDKEIRKIAGQIYSASPYSPLATAYLDGVRYGRSENADHLEQRIKKLESDIETYKNTEYTLKQIIKAKNDLDKENTEFLSDFVQSLDYLGTIKV